MNNTDVEGFEHAVISVFLIGGIVTIAVIGILWFTVLRKSRRRIYPMPAMLGTALLAQSLGIYFFFAS